MCVEIAIPSILQPLSCLLNPLITPSLVNASAGFEPTMMVKSLQEIVLCRYCPQNPLSIMCIFQSLFCLSCVKTDASSLSQKETYKEAGITQIFKKCQNQGLGIKSWKWSHNFQPSFISKIIKAESMGKNHFFSHVHLQTGLLFTNKTHLISLFMVIYVQHFFVIFAASP